MKRLVEALCILPLFALAPAPPLLAQGAEPLWYTDKTLEYPDEKYVSTVGSGGSEQEAKTNAVGELALFFKTSAAVRNEAIYAYNKAVAASGTQAARNSRVTQATVITSQEDFLGVRFTAAWRGQNRTWYVLAYIDKREAVQMYQTRIAANQRIAESLLTQANQEPEPLFRGGYLQRAAAVAALMEQDIKAKAMVGGTQEDAAALRFVQKTVSDARAFRTTLTVAVRLTGDRQNKVQRKLADVLGAQGFTVTQNRALYTLTGAVSFQEETALNGLLFVYSGLELELKNSAGTGLFSYNANIDKEGHRTWDGAYNRAILAVDKDLDGNFVSRLNAFLGGE